MLFCIAIHKLVSSLSSDLNVFYLDDGTIGGNSVSLAADLRTIEERGQELGLRLNVSKSELICKDEFAVQDFLSDFPGLQFAPPNKAVLLRSPLGEESMSDLLSAQLYQLKVIGDHLQHFHSHDAITLLRRSFAIPKLLHLLRTSPAFRSPLLVSWDNMLASILSKITNINFSPKDHAWIQAILPI